MHFSDEGRWTKHRELVLVIVLLVSLGLTGAPARAGRGISIDVDTYEIYSDASNGSVVPLSHAIDYGKGLQSSVTVQLPDMFSDQPNGPAAANVGLTFTNSPSDSLFATILGSDDPLQNLPALRLSDGAQASTPIHPVAQANTFSFGDLSRPVMAPLPPGSPGCDTSGITVTCYGPMTADAVFQFVDMSASGNPGDFKLILQCLSVCTNIGFNLGGVNFSSNNFDPNGPQLSQFSSYTAGPASFTPSGTWTFLFTNPSAVPEPRAWELMLLGFGLLGASIRRQRKRHLLN